MTPTKLLMIVILLKVILPQRWIYN